MKKKKIIDLEIKRDKLFVKSLESVVNKLYKKEKN